MIVWMKGGEKMNEQKKSITMKDVAAEAGVSVGTVSRVINNEKGIKEVTLKKFNKRLKNCLMCQMNMREA